MALNKAGLKTDLQTLFTSPPFDPDHPENLAHDCAAAWASAYAAYAAGARSCQSVGPASLSTAQSVLASALEATFSTSTTPATTAAQMAAAFTAFWLTPPVAFVGGTTPGVVTGVAGTAALQSGLPTMWAANVAGNLSASDAAQAHADILDIFTKTVLVAHSPPSACAAPVV